MKRGVPPTARNARTGELTPPGMTRRARSNSSALVGIVNARRVPGVSGRGADSWARAPRLRRSPRLRRRLAVVFAFGGQGPEEAVGDDVAHAGTKAGVERLVEERERFADRGVQLDAGRRAAPRAPPRASRRRRRRSASKRSNFSPVIAPCGEASTLSRNWSGSGTLGHERRSARRARWRRRASSRDEGGRSPSQSGSRKSASVWWLPTSTSVCGSTSSRNASR